MMNRILLADDVGIVNETPWLSGMDSTEYILSFFEKEARNKMLVRASRLDMKLTNLQSIFS